MERQFFLESERLGFSTWTPGDLPLAEALWGDPAVTRYICASGRFTPQEIADRLRTEVANGAQYGVQYWPLFLRAAGDFIGCCGLRPHGAGGYELGVHLRPAYWRQGYAAEAANAVIGYACAALGADRLFAGHNPNNTASRGLLARLGFTYTGDEFYEPTGLYHPSYEYRATNPRLSV